jgi:mRNA interferase RelE/StbE
MKYNIEFKPKAVKDFEAFPSRIQQRILAGIEKMGDNLSGDVKRLTDSTPEYRLRVGDYRVLFEVERDSIIIYRIRHRREAYR